MVKGNNKEMNKMKHEFFNFNDTTPQTIESEENSLWKAVLKLSSVGISYSNNGAEQFANNDGTEFEKEFEKCLTSVGIEERDSIELVGYTTTDLKKILKQPDNDVLWDNMEYQFTRVFGDTNVFISQPAGGNHEPDFIVYYEGKIYLFECKKSNTKTPSYGDNGCHPRVIYLMKGKWKKQLTHTYWLGSDLLSIEKYVEGLEEIEKVKEIFKRILKEYSMVNGRARLGTNQEVINVMGHSNSHLYESNVMNYILGK